MTGAPRKLSFTASGGPSVRLRAVVFIKEGDESDDRIFVDDGAEVIQRLDGLQIVSFESAGAAVHCLAALSSGARAGASCGDVLCENETLYGLPVIEASRLVDLAGPGQILCTERLLRASGESDGAASSAAPMTLRGIPHPVRVSSLDRISSESSDRHARGR